MRNIIISTTAAILFSVGSASAMDVNNSFTNNDVMAPFFTDSTMGTMKSDAELKEQLSKMNPQALQTLKDDCNDPMQYRNGTHYGLCDKIKGM